MTSRFHPALDPAKWCWPLVAGFLCLGFAADPPARRPETWAQPLKLKGVPNLHKVSDDLYRSAQPAAAGMKNLEKLGIRTVVNLRSFHSDRDEIGETRLGREAIGMKAWHATHENALKFLKIVANRERLPVLVHCQHGSDRTGSMCAVYRIVVQGWSKADAVREMREGGYGFHEVWRNLPKWLENLDVERLRKEAGIEPAARGGKVKGESSGPGQAGSDRSDRSDRSVGSRAIVYRPAEGIPGPARGRELPIPALPGPHLFLDDFEIASSTGCARVVVQPARDPAIPNPIVTGPGDGCFQPYLTVLRDADTGRYRIWYGASRPDRNTGRSQLATMESEDGIHFIRPHRICDTPEIQFGSEVLDRGKAWPEPAARYVYSYWLDGGLRLLRSPDGFRWEPLAPGVVLRHDHDIASVSFDPLRQTHVATVSTYIHDPAWTGQRRTTLMSFSPDLVRWEPPWRVLTADDRLDEGETQFYAMEGYLTRGALRIGMVKVLRDDLRARDTQPGSFGRAHTSLAWSRDGRTWVRDRAKFFEPDDRPEAWDHAHAWIDEQLVVGDSVYLYYGGYKQGHKVNRFEERQIGLVRMPLDRYAARRASGPSPGLLSTVPIRLARPAGGLRVNLNAAHGHARVQVREAATGRVVPGLGFGDCAPLTGDGLRQEVRWRRATLAKVAGQVVQLEFELLAADLFAFDFSRP